MVYKEEEMAEYRLIINNTDLNLLLDGLKDTLHRLKYDSKVNENYDKYTRKVIKLKNSILNLKEFRRIKYVRKWED